VEVNHSTLCPQGTFEYQHAIGSDTNASLQRGFEGWSNVDLPVFVDALRDELVKCTSAQMDLPATATMPARKRRIVFGPPVRAVARDAQEGAEEHDFCPCCLLTKSFDAFKEHVEGNTFCGVRLYASRDANGVAEADCRINGVDWPAGVSALLKYVATWPDR